MTRAFLTADLDGSLPEYQKAREGDQPIINTHESGLEAKAHIESQTHRYQSKKWQDDGGDNDTGVSVHNEGRLWPNLERNSLSDEGRILWFGALIWEQRLLT